MYTEYIWYIYTKCALRTPYKKYAHTAYVFKNIRKDSYDIRITILSVFPEAATYIMICNLFCCY